MALTERDRREEKILSRASVWGTNNPEAWEILLRRAWKNAFQPPSSDIQTAFDQAIHLGRKWGKEYGFPDGESVLVKRKIRIGNRRSTGGYRYVELGVSKDGDTKPAIASNLAGPAENRAVITFSTPARLLSTSPLNVSRELNFAFRYYRNPDGEATLGVKSLALEIPWDKQFAQTGANETGLVATVIPNTTQEDFAFLQKSLEILANDDVSKPVAPTWYEDTPVWQGSPKIGTLTRGRRGRRPQVVRS